MTSEPPPSHTLTAEQRLRACPRLHPVRGGEHRRREARRARTASRPRASITASRGRTRALMAPAAAPRPRRARPSSEPRWRADRSGAPQAQDAIAQVGILEREQLRAQDVALGRADPLGDVLLERSELGERRRRCSAEARPFALDLGRPDAPAGGHRPVATREDERRSPRDASGDPDAFEDARHEPGPLTPPTTGAPPP